MNSVHPDRRDIHRVITEKIVAAIEQGAGTVRMPWHRSSAGIGQPANAATGTCYRGVNVLSLWIDAMSKGFESGYWASYLQWQSIGAQVRKGERGSLVLFYKPVEPVADDPKDVEDALDKPKRFVSRASTVFNAGQVHGWHAPSPPSRSKVEKLDRAERLAKATGANIREGRYELACYDAALDLIDMPARAAFVGTETSTPTESYYAVLFHELTHWSGHKSRLGRDLKNQFGSWAYAVEELIAELGAAFLSADIGIVNEPRTDHAAYISDWLKVLNKDPRAIMQAASKAHAATDYLLAFGADRADAVAP